MKRAIKVFTLVNFGLSLGGLVWLACSKGQPSSSTTPSNTAVTKTGAPPLATLDDIISCLEGEGGLTPDGTCVRSARVDGLEVKAQLNDQYFAASKAAVPVTMSTRDRVDGYVRNTLSAVCSTVAPAAKPAPMQQAAPPPAAPSEQELTCLRTELARRTHKH